MNRIIFLFFLLPACVWAQYTGQRVGQLDPTKPEDTELVSYGAGAIREVKRAVRNAISLEHMISNDPLYDGAHRTNFFKPYMAGTNSIGGWAIMDGTIPAVKFANIPGPKLITNVVNSAISSTNANVSLTASPTSTSGLPVLSATISTQSNKNYSAIALVQYDASVDLAVFWFLTNNVVKDVYAASGLRFDTKTLHCHFRGNGTNITISVRGAPVNGGAIFINRAQGATNQTFGSTAKSTLTIWEMGD